MFLGGAKGGGKSWVLRFAPLRWVHLPGFNAVIFRREVEQVKNPGGQWDKSFEVYPHLGGKANKSYLHWDFPSGARIKFSGLKDKNDGRNWFGTEVAFYGFDQLEEFEQQQFFDVLSCKRTTSGAPTQVMITANPDYSSWVRQLVDPWIANDGYVNLDMDGRVRYFTIQEDMITWVDADWRDPNDQPPISMVYFSADVWDNQVLLESDPQYLSALMAQSAVERERYLGIKGRGGNWNIVPTAGKCFKSEWFRFIDERPKREKDDRFVRFWDLAATEKKVAGDDPDYTAGVLVQFRPDKDGNEHGWVLDVKRSQAGADRVDDFILSVATTDPPNTIQVWEEERSGSAPKRDSHYRREMLKKAGIRGEPRPVYGDKVMRANLPSAAIEHGRLVLVRGDRNNDFIAECAQFPDGDHDDQVDALSGAWFEVAMASPLIGQYRA